MDYGCYMEKGFTMRFFHSFMAWDDILRVFVVKSDQANPNERVENIDNMNGDGERVQLKSLSC